MIRLLRIGVLVLVLCGVFLYSFSFRRFSKSLGGSAQHHESLHSKERFIVGKIRNDARNLSESKNNGVQEKTAKEKRYEKDNAAVQNAKRNAIKTKDNPVSAKEKTRDLAVDIAAGDPIVEPPVQELQVVTSKKTKSVVRNASLAIINETLAVAVNSNTTNSTTKHHVERIVKRPSVAHENKTKSVDYGHFMQEALADLEVKGREVVLRELEQKLRNAKARDVDIRNVVNALMTQAGIVANDGVKVRRRRGNQKRTNAEEQVVIPEQMISIRDPLASTPKRGSVKALPFSPQVEYLGILVDAGRQYYSITWLKRLIRYLHYMRFNLIHFRLTDDQAFAIRLDSHPEFAKPSAVNGTVYTPTELRELVAYAHARNITIMPEINLPGHAGAWQGIPGILVPCPYFICSKGYGIPLNVEHPQLFPILKDMITEVKSIFHTSPFFHFGGDEVHMSSPCFREAGIEMYDYEEFERKLAEVVNEAGVDRAIRWEMTGQRGPDVRVVSMEHYWLTRKYETDENGTVHPFFASQGLYFDSNKQKDGFYIYWQTRNYLTPTAGSRPTAIIAGAFELGMDTWLDRNVMGRLLAVAMGASGIDFTVNNVATNNTAPANDTVARATLSVEEEDDDEVVFEKKYFKLCKSLAFDENLCSLHGRPSVPEARYQATWEGHWDKWKTDICDRLTIAKPARAFTSRGRNQKSAGSIASEMFWESFMFHVDPIFFEEQFYSEHLNELNSTNHAIQEFAVPYRGISLDLVRGVPGENVTKRLLHIIDVMSELDFNLLQLRLNDDLGFAMHLTPRLSLRRSENEDADYDNVIPKIVEYAYHKAIFVMPEISFTTRSGGWSDSLAHVQCPNVLCDKGVGLAIDMTEPTVWPILAVTLKVLRFIFSSKFIHLGYDERKESMACFNEAQMAPDFDSEEKLKEILRIERIPVENVLRWENKEQEIYSKRAGSITHYRFSEGPTSGNNSSPWFVSTDLALDEPESKKFDAWSIYQRTRSLAAKFPTGIVASVGVIDAKSWKTLNIKGRLLAMSMALTKQASMDYSNEDDFREQYNTTCHSLSPGYHCNKYGFVNASQSWWTIRKKVAESWVEQACRVRTREIVERLPRKGVLVE